MTVMFLDYLYLASYPKMQDSSSFFFFHAFIPYQFDVLLLVLMSNQTFFDDMDDLSIFWSL